MLIGGPLLNYLTAQLANTLLSKAILSQYSVVFLSSCLLSS
jgi:hypothetical protein